MSDRNCITYWLPRLQAADLPVPRTLLFQMPQPAAECIYAGFDGKEGSPGTTAAFLDFVREIQNAVIIVGGPPAFLRTGLTSGKHSWNETCFLDAGVNVAQHIFHLAEHSECAGMPGLDWDVWAVREFLPTKPIGVCPHYGDMPVVREFRMFVDGGKVKCVHPYWPIEAIREGGAPDDCGWRAASLFAEELLVLNALASRAGEALGGQWSVDILDTENGWFITDCALAADSFHWEDCVNAPKPN